MLFGTKVEGKPYNLQFDGLAFDLDSFDFLTVRLKDKPELTKSTPIVL
jgi:hypothetical protein